MRSGCWENLVEQKAVGICTRLNNNIIDSLIKLIESSSFFRKTWYAMHSVRIFVAWAGNYMEGTGIVSVRNGIIVVSWGSNLLCSMIVVAAV